jgi:hypothetical protein
MALGVVLFVVQALIGANYYGEQDSYPWFLRALQWTALALVLRRQLHEHRAFVHGITFGGHPVSAAVALGDGGAALQHAKAVHPVQLPVVERRAQYLVDVARGHGQAGGDDQALRALLKAADMCALEPERAAHVRYLHRMTVCGALPVPGD